MPTEDAIEILVEYTTSDAIPAELAGIQDMDRVRRLLSASDELLQWLDCYSLNKAFRKRLELDDTSEFKWVFDLLPELYEELQVTEEFVDFRAEVSENRREKISKFVGAIYHPKVHITLRSDTDPVVTVGELKKFTCGMRCKFRTYWKCMWLQIRSGDVEVCRAFVNWLAQRDKNSNPLRFSQIGVSARSFEILFRAFPELQKRFFLEGDALDFLSSTNQHERRNLTLCAKDISMR